MTERFTCFYDVLKEALMGKVVVLRNYEDDRDEYVWPDEGNGPPTWNEDAKFVEWRGTVVDVLQNDNSHVDIIFARDEHYVPPANDPDSVGQYLGDCYNWHMRDHIKIIQAT